MHATLKGSDVVRTSPSSPLKPMDPSNNNPNQPPYYYPHNVGYPQDVYIQDESPSDNQSYPATMYQQEQEQQFAYDRYQRQQIQLQMQQQLHHPLLQSSRSQSNLQSPPPPLPQQAYHQQSLLQQQHEQLRQVHHQRSLPMVSPTLRHSVSADRVTSSPRVSHSPVPEASYDSDALSSLRHDLQVHAAATALTQAASDHYSSSAVPRLPPIHQVEKQQVTTTATQAASASRRRNEATFRCPVPGCNSTFTRRFNLKGHLRSHTSERPFVCDWPGCEKGFARQHDCKRHYQLHSAKAGHMCQGCRKSFSRTDALNRHLRSEGGAECRSQHQTATAGGSSSTILASGEELESQSDDSATDGTPDSRSPSV